jgi:hypothetical protein
MRFLRHEESIGPMELLKPSETWAGYRLPLVGPEPSKGRDGSNCASCSSSTMSSTGYSSIGLLASRARLRFTGIPIINPGHNECEDLSLNGTDVFFPCLTRPGHPTYQRLSALISG